MQFDERVYRYPARADLRAGARDRIEHPRCYNRDDAGLRFDLHEPPGDTLLAAAEANATPVEGMPAIMDHDFLPDMGRMTRRLRRHEVDPSSDLPRVGPARSYEAVPRCAEAGSAVADPPASKPAAGPVPRSGWKSESGPIDVDAIMSGVLEATAVSRPMSNWPVRRKRTR
jgi:hypothetical protein